MYANTAIAIMNSIIMVLDFFEDFNSLEEQDKADNTCND